MGYAEYYVVIGTSFLLLLSCQADGNHMLNRPEDIRKLLVASGFDKKSSRASALESYTRFGAKKSTDQLQTCAAPDSHSAEFRIRRLILDGLKFQMDRSDDVEEKGYWLHLDYPCCTIARSGQPSANARMYLRFREERPDMSGNASRRSAESRSMTLAPQPSWACRCRIVWPMSQ